MVPNRLDGIRGDQTGTQLANTINGTRSTVNGVDDVVTSIQKALPTEYDCRFSCQ